MSFNFGLCSISFRKNTPQEILTETKNAGLSYIEWGSDVHAPQKDIEKLTNIANLQKEYNIKCSSYGTYFRIGVTPTEELQEYINAAKILGTDVLRLWCGNKNSQDYNEEEKAALFNECKKIAAIAEENAVTVCMECHNGTYTNTEKSALELIKAVNSKAFLMYWQPQQFMSFEENLSYAKNISGFVKHIHVFNWKGDNRFPLADGINFWKEYLKCFENNKILLLEFMPDDKIESLANESDALKLITK